MKPELLCPAGSPESLRAAVQNGADAVYLGWGEFNARRGAKNFTDTEFTDALAYCHERGVRVFLTLNTLLSDRELPQALSTARRACLLGVDAVLVQDWGLLSLLRESLPDLPLHASTQMSIFTSGGACEAAAAGMERVVIARECSKEDTAAICENCPAEVEVFVHGALCMCYSGQCAMSAIIGGRSGNRGRCAQPCRLPYGVNEPAGSRYPLSLKDSCLAGQLGDMESLGVACLKLEGRMKRPEYVAVVTNIYARLLREKRGPTAGEMRELEEAFSRSGFTDWYWQSKRGAGMFGTRPEDAADPKELFAAAKAAYQKDSLRTIGVRFTCRVLSGVPATLSVQDEDGNLVSVSGPVPEPARNHAVAAEELSDRLKKTGGTAYACEAVDVTVDGGLSLSAAAVNALRRAALTALTEVRTQPPARRVLDPAPLPDIDCSAPEPRFTVSVTSAAQITPELLDCGPARVCVPLELLETMTGLPAGATEWCAVLPRVWRDRDERHLREQLKRSRAMGVEAVLLGNLGHFPLTADLGLRRYGDFGLNVFNSRSLAFLKGKGLQGACASFELRASQLRDLKKILPVEAIVYGRLPLMVTENCIICNSVGCRCDRPNVLMDRTGAKFPLLSVFGHRTEVENSRVLYLGDRDDYRCLGLAFARLRFTTESPEECVQVFRAYQTGDAPPADFTRGLFDRGVE